MIKIIPACFSVQAGISFQKKATTSPLLFAKKRLPMPSVFILIK